MKNADLERARLQASLVIEEEAFHREWCASAASCQASDAKRPTSARAHMVRQQVKEFRADTDGHAERRHLVGFAGPFCDSWEKASLEGFTRGQKEADSPFESRGVHYFRLMRPLYANSSCLKCHKDFKPGKVSGAIAVGIPTAPLRSILRRRIREEILTHAAVGALVLALIAFLYFRLKGDLDKIRVLKGILPICSFCKKIRNDEGDWSKMESYIRDHSEAIFSHALCTSCLEKNYPDYAKDLDKPG